MESSSYKIIDQNTWNRKEHFDFFSAFKEPFSGVTVPMDVTKAYEYCKQQSYSISKYILHCAIYAANDIAAFRYRIKDDQVICYDAIHVNSVYLRKDQTFSFSYINFLPDFELFSQEATQVGLALEKTSGLGINPATNRQDSIHFSMLPWLDFTSLSHARSLDFRDSCPKISFGKITIQQQKRLISCSIHAHHGLVDGIHKGQFVERFQELLDRNI
ncbi:MAG: CatA-like O-acetyltransferase [Gilvibacter sp.]